MQITRTSLILGVTRTLDLPVAYEQIAANLAGTLIPDAFRKLMRWQREIILTGITEEEWQAAFPPDDEIEPDVEGEP